MSLDPTYSAAEVGAHLGLSRSEIHRLRVLGEQFGRELHPSRGGLWPSFHAGSRRRRYPLAAIERHKQHHERLDHDAAFAARQVERATRLGLGEPVITHLERRLERILERSRPEVAA